MRCTIYDFGFKLHTCLEHQGQFDSYDMVEFSMIPWAVSGIWVVESGSVLVMLVVLLGANVDSLRE
jgi:hypothetical protein